MLDSQDQLVSWRRELLPDRCHSDSNRGPSHPIRSKTPDKDTFRSTLNYHFHLYDGEVQGREASALNGLWLSLVNVDVLSSPRLTRTFVRYRAPVGSIDTSAYQFKSALRIGYQ